MAKRFTDTDKWKKPFIRSLQAPYKLLWFYILDDCNHAGIWEVDIEVASLRIGEELDGKKALTFFGDRVHKISSSKWFIPDFISFQYGELNEKNRVHFSIIQILNKYKIKHLISPLQRAKDKDMDKEQDMDMDKDSFGKSENLLLIPQMFEVFKKYLPNYLGSTTKDYKPLYSIASYFCEIGKLDGSPDMHRDKILEVWSSVCQSIAKNEFYKQKSLLTISNHIQEIIQNVLYGKSTSKNGKSDYGSTERADEYDRMFAERYANWRPTTG